MKKTFFIPIIFIAGFVMVVAILEWGKHHSPNLSSPDEISETWESFFKKEKKDDPWTNELGAMSIYAEKECPNGYFASIFPPEFNKPESRYCLSLPPVEGEKQENIEIIKAKGIFLLNKYPEKEVFVKAFGLDSRRVSKGFLMGTWDFYSQGNAKLGDKKLLCFKKIIKEHQRKDFGSEIFCTRDTLNSTTFHESPNLFFSGE